MALIIFELSKLLLTYLLVKFIFELIRTADEITTLMSRTVRRCGCLNSILHSVDSDSHADASAACAITCSQLLETGVWRCFDALWMNTDPLTFSNRACYYIYMHARFKEKKDEMCSICLCKSTDSVLQCGHGFHWGCVHLWLNEKNTCPVCRTHQKRWKEHCIQWCEYFCWCVTVHKWKN